MHIEAETFHDGANIGREAVDVTVEIWCEMVRVVEQPVEAAAFGRLSERELGQIVERDAGDLRKAVADDILAFRFDGGVFLQHFRPWSARGCNRTGATRSAAE